MPVFNDAYDKTRILGKGFLCRNRAKHLSMLIWVLDYWISLGPCVFTVDILKDFIQQISCLGLLSAHPQDSGWSICRKIPCTEDASRISALRAPSISLLHASLGKDGCLIQGSFCLPSFIPDLFTTEYFTCFGQDTSFLGLPDGFTSVLILWTSGCLPKCWRWVKTFLAISWTVLTA